MSFDTACRQLSDWIAESNGVPIALPSGRMRSFRQTTAYTDTELCRYESELNVVFPDACRHLLISIGSCHLFYGGTEFANGLEIHDLAELRQRYVDYFDEENGNLFSQFIPVGCDNRLQEIAAYCVGRPAPNNFLIMSHETLPEDWCDTADELASWCTLEDWVIEAVTTEGDLDVH